MNSDFNFARFKMVVANDWKKFLSQYGVSLLVLLLIPVANWNSMIFFEDSLGCGTRLFLLSVLYILAIIMAPARMYSDVNQPKRGIYFAMLPASKLEKFLSMVLYCFIVTPLAFLIGSFAIDTLLAVLPFGPSSRNYLWDISDDFGFAIYPVVMTSVSSVAIFFFTNTLFRRKKVILTILCGIGLIFSITTMASIFFAITDFDTDFDFEILGISFYYILPWVATALLVLFSWRRIKNMKY